MRRVGLGEIYSMGRTEVPLRLIRRREDAAPPCDSFLRVRGQPEWTGGEAGEFLVVRRVGEGYELLSGDRVFLRWAAEGRESGPCVVVEMDEREALIARVVLAGGRRELNPLEEARIYLRLAQEFGMSQDRIGAEVGKVQSTIANKMRLLKLEPEIQEGLRTGQIGERHARALLRVGDPELRVRMFRECSRKGWSAEEMEIAVAVRTRMGSRAKTRSRRRLGVYRDLRIFQNALREIAREMLRAGLRCEVSDEDKDGCWSFRVEVFLRDAGEVEVARRTEKNEPE